MAPHLPGALWRPTPIESAGGEAAVTPRIAGWVRQTPHMETSAADVLEIGLLLGLAAAAGWLMRRLGLPAILGYLAVGLVVSPFTPGYVANRQQLGTLASVGVVLLLFEVGIEIDPMRLRHEHGRLLWLAPLQVLITLGAALGAGMVMGLNLQGGLVLGLAVALSSSVVAVNITRSRRRTTNPETERALLGWSVLQDGVGVAVSMGLLASLQGNTHPLDVTVAGIGLFVLIALAAAWLLPRVLRRLRTEPDLFLIVTVAAGLALAGLGSRAFGVPLALAAFVAGLGVGESPVAAEARARLLPLRDVFAVMFFVSVGTLIDPGAVPRSLAWLGVAAGVLVLGKVGVTYVLARLAHLDEVRPGQLTVGLGQVGEFTYVIGAVGVSRSAIPAQLYTGLLVLVVVSIAATSVAVRLGRRRVSEAPVAAEAEGP